MTPEVYVSAFWSSSCCGAPFWRVCFGGGTPDRYVCQRCETECGPVHVSDVRWAFRGTATR
jgi:hypothetical protein